MIEYGTKGAASPGYTCFYPKNPDDPRTLLCDRDGLHLGRHAAWNGSDRRTYWERAWRE